MVIERAQSNSRGASGGNSNANVISDKYALVYSLLDPAGQLIFKKIEEIGVPKWAAPYDFSEEIIFINTRKIKENKIIFLSKHSSDSKRRTLSVHMIGNFGRAEFGGRSGELCGALPRVGTNYLRTLNEKNISSGLSSQGFGVSFEATHHGPFTSKESVFIELGSSLADWKNELGARVIAQTVVEATLKPNKDEIVVGLGGGHYCPDFTKLALRQNYSFGHICAKHNLQYLNKELLLEMVEKSGAEKVIIDWKGLKENKKNVVELCKKTGVVFEKVQTLLK